MDKTICVWFRFEFGGVVKDVEFGGFRVGGNCGMVWRGKGRDLGRVRWLRDPGAGIDQ